MRTATICFALVSSLLVHAQVGRTAWGTYNNPILHADYSDPDAIRVGDDYYMTASSFTHVPGLPILHSKDLVHWKLIGHALTHLEPADHFSKVQHGGGVWAPAIRFRNELFYIYYPDPDFGIYVVTAKHAAGPWSKPVLVLGGKGLIDPCPLWDDDGRAYLVHAFAGSRAGIKSLLAIRPMNASGTKVSGEAVQIFDGHDTDPTVEGPKLYKRNGYFYVFAPAGGVSTGWQLVLRSKNIYGPYERRVVMDQGTTAINGPHQGAWVNTKYGTHWFLHFQDKDAYGRIVHLQPVKWVNDWPVIGEDPDGDGKGQPVVNFEAPLPPVKWSLPSSDEFNLPVTGLQWQWQANPQLSWGFATPDGNYRLYSVLLPDSGQNVWHYPNILGQKFPAESFIATVKLRFGPRHEGEQFGLVVLGADYAFAGIQWRKGKLVLSQHVRLNADKQGAEQVMEIAELPAGDVYLRIRVKLGALCSFAYSINGADFTTLQGSFAARPGRWVGAKLGMFCVRSNPTNDAGFADIDWFRVEPQF